MSTNMQDRPARPGRSKPVPAPDAGVDPIDYKPATSEPQPTPTTSTRESAPAEGKGARSVPAAAPTPQASTQAAPAASAPAASGGREQTVQLSSRVSPQIAQLIDAAAARTGRSKRELIEAAIAAAPWL